MSKEPKKAEKKMKQRSRYYVVLRPEKKIKKRRRKRRRRGRTRRQGSSRYHHHHRPMNSVPPVDVLDPILAHLDLSNHIRLAAACKSLRQRFMRENPPTPSKLFHFPTTQGATFNCPNFLSRFLKPPTSREDRRRRRSGHEPVRRLLGYSDDWMLVLHCCSFTDGRRGSSSYCYFFDRISGSSAVRLPNFETRIDSDIVKVALPSKRSSMGCVVAACITSGKNTLHACRPREGKPWMEVVMFNEDGEAMDLFSRFVFDVAIHRGKLWVASDKGLYEGDLAAWPPSGLRRSESQPPASPTWRRTFVGETGGRLLVVTKHHEGTYVDLAKASFRVWELREGKLVRWSDLRGGALLLSRCWLALVDARELGSSLLPDCIYHEIALYKCRDRDGNGEFTYAADTLKKRFLFQYLLD